MTTTEIDTLHKFGSAFQTKAIAALCNDQEFVEQSLDIISTKFFDSESSGWIVETVLSYFKEYKKLPTLEVFKIESDKIKSDVLRVSAIETLKNVFQHKSDTDLEYVKKTFLEFCKNQQIKNAIINSVDLLQRGEYDNIKVIIDKALKAGASRNVGHDWKTEIDLRTSHVARDTVPTPWDTLNKVMDGGLAAGELATIISSSGSGKSWLLSAIGAHALKLGKTVLHYTLELNENYVGLRYDTIFAGVEPTMIKHNLERVRAIVDAVQGELKIKYFPTRTVNTNALAAHLQRLQMLNFIPDIMIIDYADLIRSNERAEARYQELGYIYEDLRSLAGEYGFPVWTASQSQRSSMQDDIIEADKVAGSYEKIMTADFVMSLSRKVNDKVMNTARVHVIKNRFGPDGMTFPAKMEIAKGKFEIYDEQSANGIIAKKDMDNDTLLKSKLFDKFQSTRANQPESSSLLDD